MRETLLLVLLELASRCQLHNRAQASTGWQAVAGATVGVSARERNGVVVVFGRGTTGDDGQQGAAGSRSGHRDDNRCKALAKPLARSSVTDRGPAPGAPGRTQAKDAHARSRGGKRLPSQLPEALNEEWAMLKEEERLEAL